MPEFKNVRRIYVEKLPGFDVEANGVASDLRLSLGISGLEAVRLLNRYDIQGISDEDFSDAVNTVFSEPPVDAVYDQLPEIGTNDRIFASQYLPGQFDQRADSAAQCIQLATCKERPLIRTARVYILSGNISDEQFAQIKSYLINPVESLEASLDEVDTLSVEYEIKKTVETLTGFIALDDAGLAKFLADYALAMDFDDIKFCQNYFASEKRDPTITEIRMIDTYWSDHCRHTTFLTHIGNVDIESEAVRKSFEKYLECRKLVYGDRDKPMSLMDLATIGTKTLKKQGLVPDLDESEEINACSVKIDVEIDGVKHPYLLMFKNETHNHPTEIEPFGGAATCLGGAIRDPLSGRSYVYQAMRVTGAADPLLPVSETMPGKLPQKKICTTAAAGYSSYGNQIGLATGHVSEIYHPGYAAKRLEIGAVVGAAPAENVKREVPAEGDIIILLGGRTGRDGCGGATGSSKSHTLESLSNCGAEVQKGNAPEERKLQRLFRNPEVTAMIKRCNDFGAGGVSVAIGELADGLEINLDAVTKKYDGLDGTELAISESQERMAVVVAKEDVDRFIAESSKENLEATPVAVVTSKARLVMNWNGNTIVDISRDFLNSNGAPKLTDIAVNAVNPLPRATSDDIAETWKKMVSDLNICSQKGLVERFDSTIGANTIIMPFGGKYQLTPAQAMAAKIPLIKGDTSDCSVMAWGYDPYLSSASPYHGAIYAVVQSIARLVACGADIRKCWLTFQEYFERTKNDPSRWGKPFAALLGALEAQLRFEVASIGGKDSMSGTFENIDVPPTLVSFAVAMADANKVISPEFKRAGSAVYYVPSKQNTDETPDFDYLNDSFENMRAFIADGKAASVWSISGGGVAEGITKMAFGNRIGFRFDTDLSADILFGAGYGGFLVEADESPKDAVKLGETIADYRIESSNFYLDLADLQKMWEDKLEPVYPVKAGDADCTAPSYSYTAVTRPAPAIKLAAPRVLIPVFPGTNCEYDTAKRFEAAGAKAEIVVVRNLTPSDVEQSVEYMTKAVANAQIIAIPGGFSGGDEPDGSGKFIVSFFRNPMLKNAVHEMLKNRDGLMCGICNGFQALIKLGLVPYGEITDMTSESATLTFNLIGRHQSMLTRTVVASNKSPWLSRCNVGDIYTVPISHGEGRFTASPELITQLAENGQIATQYADLDGTPSMSYRYNPNYSVCAIEGITSPDGRVFGKMAHSERTGSNLYKNVDGNIYQPIFESAVDYFTK
ncbi:MAG: phosphoribosylformylglycinamidine synthase [Ruminococcaceae bacterium]|nr:phosphoribosylformylglycinamidine synthase [Oscillospiraceae bacterium]